MSQTAGPSRDSLRDALAGLRALAEPEVDHEALAALEEAAGRLGRADFRLVVLGEYKRGKTTLVNALLGSAVLPTAVVPLTSVLTEVRHGPAPEARIQFDHGEARRIPLDELPAYVTEPGNPRNHKGVARAIVSHPAPLLAEGVVIVDTPGIGSVFEHNSRLTYDSLEEADAVVFVLAADQPLSAEERALLRALGGVTDRILFAVNRVDVPAPAEAEESLRFIRKMLATLEEHPPEHVHPLSARRALEARAGSGPDPGDFIRFEGALRRVLIGRKSDILRARGAGLARKAGDLLALRLESERRTLRLAGDRLERALERFRTAIPGIERKVDESAALLKHRVGNIPRFELRPLADETRAAIVAALWPRVEAEVRSAAGGSQRSVAHRLSGEIGAWVVDELQPYYPATERRVLRSLEQVVEEHAERVQTAAGEVVALANQLLDMRAAVPRVLPPTPGRPRFYFREWDYSGGALRIPAWSLWLPRRLAEPRILTALRELLLRRVNQNLEAVRYDWTLRLDDVVRRIQAASRDQLEAIVGVVREALERAERRRSEGGVEARMSELDRRLGALAGIRSALDGAYGTEPSPPAGTPA